MATTIIRQENKRDKRKNKINNKYQSDGNNY